MNDHLPFTIDGEDAEEFKEAINTIPIIEDDETANEKIDSLCEKMKKASIIRS